MEKLMALIFEAYIGKLSPATELTNEDFAGSHILDLHHVKKVQDVYPTSSLLEFLEEGPATVGESLNIHQDQDKVLCK